MPYIMRMSVDGGCRRNGYSNAIGAAACVVEEKWGRSTTWTCRLPSHTTATNQRAEIQAIILALEQVLEKYDELRSNPLMMVTISTDSKYAHGCMTDWIYKWTRNGWINSAGRPVANKDLIEKASDLDDRVKELGEVEYKWVARAGNQAADAAVNEVLDKMDSERGGQYDTDSDSDYY
ncbi:hypothetical protein MMC28_009117 [Mycoblastus sanguinarius]|nr:hypothetical protein [Mycoblastus sanguinarius]